LVEWKNPSMRETESRREKKEEKKAFLASVGKREEESHNFEIGGGYAMRKMTTTIKLKRGAVRRKVSGFLKKGRPGSAVK